MRQFTSKERKAYERLCRLSTDGALRTITEILKTKYNEIISTPAYTIAIGSLPVALLAHADTVFKTPPKQFFYDYEANVIWSPEGMGADDRAGIFAIMQILKTDYRPSIIITTGEERGGIGANKIAARYPIWPGDPLKFMIQLDRRGTNDSVYYDCGNIKFEKYINQFGFNTAWGTFTDISILAPRWKYAAVNLSIGYREEHQEIEHLYVGEMFSTIEKVIKIFDDVKANPEMEAFEYIEVPYYLSWDNVYAYPIDDDEDFWRPSPDTCSWCGTKAKPEELFEVHMDEYSSPMRLCLDCFSKCNESIDWCAQCKTAWYLDYEESQKKYQLNVKENKPYKYICPKCRRQGKNDRIKQPIPIRSKSH